MAICDGAGMPVLRSTATGLLLPLLLLALATPAAARDSLGIFDGWGAFRDPAVPRCYAIAQAEPSSQAREYQPYVAIGTWPRRGERGQVHFRVSRRLAPRQPITLTLGRQRRWPAPRPRWMPQPWAARSFARKLRRLRLYAALP